MPSLRELSTVPDLIGLSVVRFTLENMDAIFKDWLEDNISYFITMLNEEIFNQSCVKSLKWDDLILRLEWKWSIESIFKKDYQDHKELILNLAKQFPLQFDATLVKEILESGEVSEEKIKEAAEGQEWKDRFAKWRSDRLK